MTNRTLRYGLRTLLALGLVAGTVSGCAEPANNEDPRAGAPGAVTEPTVTALCDAQSILAAVTAETSLQTDRPQILGVCNENRLTVVFTTFKDGEPVVPEEGDVSAVVSKLIVDDDGGDRWQSYTNRLEDPGSGDWPLSAPKVQATTDRGGAVTEVTEGVYTYEFATDVSNVTEPLEVAWEPGLTHRVGLEFRGSMEDQGLGNPVFTWEPQSGVTVETARAIVAQESCNECHKAGLALHGGARNETNYCVLCHNPGSTDANSGNTVDFPIMVHKIHMGDDLPSGEYAIWGFRDSKHDYSGLRYPQDQRNCLKCHDPAIPATPDAARWDTTLNRQLCQSCHDNVSFESGTTTHPVAVADDSTCVDCHGEGRSLSVERAHRTPFSTPHNPNLPGGVPLVTYEVKDVDLAGDPATMPVATFAVYLDGNALDLSSLTYKGIDLTSLPSLTVTFNMPEGGLTDGGSLINKLLDFNNFWGDANPSLGKWAQPESVDIKDLISNLTVNGDGTYTTKPSQLPALPEGARNVSVFMQGYVGVDRDDNGSTGRDERHPGVSVIAGEESGDTPRREVVSQAKCLTCHEKIAFHGSNRVDNPNVCVACHNPNATDGRRRPSDASTTPDGLAERPIAFSSMIHSIHRGEDLSTENYVLYGFSGPHGFTDVAFPGNLANCETCHNPGTYGLPIAENALAVTLLTGNDKTSPLDDFNVSPTGAACTGCHDKPTTKAHAQASSAVATTMLHGTENDSCVTCHGPGAGWDVENIHNALVSE